MNGGELDGRRVLRPETVAIMTVNRVPDVLMPIGFSRPMLGTGWSLGFCVVMDAGEYAYPVSEGEFWWDGSAGTRFWIDPEKDMVAVVKAGAARGGGFREAFKTLVYGAIVDEL